MSGRIIRFFLWGLLMTQLLGCGSIKEQSLNTYGVFLSYNDSLEKLEAYQTVVIDAQYYEKNEIKDFQTRGHKVYSYINVGSLESFREYYDTYAHLTLGPYEHWEEECWIDVSKAEWQDFILEKLADELLQKGIDGFFVDNCDVFYMYQDEEIFEGLTTIMEGLTKTGKEVIINGGDYFVHTYCENGGNWKDILTGLNQEDVFSSINWETGAFGKANRDEKLYFTEFLEKYENLGATIYLLEYTTDSGLISEIQKYCNEHHFQYYISDSLELDL